MMRTWYKSLASLRLPLALLGLEPYLLSRLPVPVGPLRLAKAEKVLTVIRGPDWKTLHLLQKLLRRLELAKSVSSLMAISGFQIT
jgi:hypothetical protein